MEILEGEQSQQLFNDYLICWRDFFLARAVIQVGKQKWGEERGGQLYSNFFEIPSPKREGQNINSTLIIKNCITVF